MSPRSCLDKGNILVLVMSTRILVSNQQLVLITDYLTRIQKSVQNCNDTLPASTATIKKCKDTASLWADMLHKKDPKNNFFAARDKIWAVKRNEQLTYLVHPCWFTGDKKIKALCITNRCNMVCAINALNSHYHYNKLQT